MKRLTINEAEYLAQIMREQIGMSISEQASVKTVQSKLDILTIKKLLRNLINMIFMHYQ